MPEELSDGTELSLDTITETIKGLSETNLRKPLEVRKAALEMEKLLLPNADTIDAEALIKLLGRTTVKRTRKLYERYETELEYETARKFITGEYNSVTDYPLYERFVPLVDAEIKLAKITREDRVLWIGGGPNPISAEQLALKTGAIVSCLDKSQRATRTSTKVLDQLRLSDKVWQANLTAQNQWNLGKYKVIVVALLAKPKWEILDKIHQSSDDTRPRVILRTSYGVNQLFYEPFDTKNLADYAWEIKGSYVAQGDNTVSSLLLGETNSYDPRTDKPFDFRSDYN